ncbi:LysR family transcriptional regulator [Ralstonia pickettii]|jgi:LysR family transcriptional activator of nhaA|uniref:Transcriptional regulator, LysR family n=3 Tax=Ralstonia TaxID=48736 RepID=C6BKY9_RALP1|nr:MULTISPECIES: LysR substrate-binding domain-containing protein [Ralstonia]MDE2202236.1 LysR family transcriptional regulator [Burkholderiaceae bacterium]MBA9883086.1 LysR family transcriptional regulator [Ralstonia pickettii]MBA9892862.1 LysR family transcriptional regulator [Ralstonia pickettii]MBA9925123.1 LysR family transcriptional regulator [Ralstonia pickettii]MBB0093626.1 LysR family transcriptional regulator [Ralstonia pickettii]
MRLEQLNFHHLFYFWRVAKAGHLTRVATELHTSQSALSAQIRQLEDRLGEPLFAREGRRLVLTDTGQLVLSYAEDIFGLGQEMLGRLVGRSEGMTRLRVGSVATLSRNYQENWIRPALADPSVVLTLESGVLEGLLARLLQHQLDVVLANETVPSNADRPLHCRFLGSQSISLVGPAGVWKNRSLRIPDDLQGLDIALPGPRHALRSQFDALCASAGVTPHLRAEVDDMAMLRLIARDSGWLTVLPEVVVQDELRAGVLVTVGQSTQLQERFYAITTTRRHRIEALERLLSD